MAYSPTNWQEGQTSCGPTNFNKLENGLQAAAGVADAAIPKSTVTTAGDLIYASGNATVTRLAIGASTKVLGGGATAPAWVNPPGYEWVYTEITSNVTVSGTSGAQTSVITSGSATYDGAAVMIEFYSESVITGAADAVNLELYEDSTSIGLIGLVSTGGVGGEVVAAPVLLRRRRTPSAASHTYTVKAYRTTNNGTVQASSGGAATVAPAYIRVTKV